tara:strand:- start:1687 stop:2370 length:684 start_codon:yes stop_codon:yes gene_type:complete
MDLEAHIDGIFPSYIFNFDLSDKVDWKRLIPILDEEVDKRHQLEEEQNAEKFKNPIPTQMSQTVLVRAVQTLDRELHRRQEFAELTAWIKICLEYYRKRFEMQCEKLEPTLMWGNKSIKHAQHHAHYHTMSLISGVFHLHDGIGTCFTDPVEQKLRGLQVFDKTTNDTWTPQAYPGQLILFPAYMKHYTEPHQGDDPRWSIAFNSFPSGKCNWDEHDKIIAVDLTVN